MKLSILLFVLLGALGTITACKSKKETSESKKEMDHSGHMMAPKAATAHNHSGAVRNGFPTKPKAGTAAFCPVMKNQFSVSKSTEWTVYKGKYYGFCCPGCKPKFEKNPEKYIKILEI